MLRNVSRQTIRIILASAVMIIALAFASFAQEKLEVHFIDVGQADSILIKCEGHNMIIDGGNSEDSQKIYTYLKKHGVTNLDYIVNSHGDADHVGGLPGAVQLVGNNIGKVLAPYDDLDKERFQVFVKKLAQFGKTITVPKTGEKYTLGNAEFQILSVGSKSGENKDNESIVLRLKYGDNSFVFTGDAGEDQEKEIINAGYEIESDVLKVGHHGSSTSTCYQFLREVFPKAAVICAGKDNSYGHPTDTVLSRLRDEGAEVFRTDNNGTIVMTCDGHEINYSTEKEYNRDTNLIPGGQSSGTQSSAAKSSAALSIAEQNETDNSKGKSSAENNTGNATNTGNAQSYVLNKNTKKFHYPSCASVGQMKEKNKENVTDTRENIIAKGYAPCKNCNP